MYFIIKAITLKLVIPKKIMTYLCYLIFKYMKSMKSNKEVRHVPHPT